MSWRSVLSFMAVLVLQEGPALTIHRSFRSREVGFGGGIGAVVPVESRVSDAIDEGRAKSAERTRVYVGRVTSVSAGDVLCIVTSGGTRVEVLLDLIDAPETDQPYGKESTEYLKKLVHGREVRVEYKKCDCRGRVLGRVTLKKQDVNLKMVAAGMAWYCGLPDRTPGYAEADAAARKGKKGLWADDNPINPAQWKSPAKLPGGPGN